MFKILKNFIQTIFDKSFSFLDEAVSVLDSTPVAAGIWDDDKLWVDGKQWIDQG